MGSHLVVCWADRAQQLLPSHKPRRHKAPGPPPLPGAGFLFLHGFCPPRESNKAFAVFLVEPANQHAVWVSRSWLLLLVRPSEKEAGPYYYIVRLEITKWLLPNHRMGDNDGCECGTGLALSAALRLRACGPGETTPWFALSHLFPG